MVGVEFPCVVCGTVQLLRTVWKTVWQQHSHKDVTDRQQLLCRNNLEAIQEVDGKQANTQLGEIYSGLKTVAVLFGLLMIHKGVIKATLSTWERLGCGLKEKKKAGRQFSYTSGTLLHSFAAVAALLHSCTSVLSCWSCRQFTSLLKRL